MLRNTRSQVFCRINVHISKLCDGVIFSKVLRQAFRRKCKNRICFPVEFREILMTSFQKQPKAVARSKKTFHNVNPLISPINITSK